MAENSGFFCVSSGAHYTVGLSLCDHALCAPEWPSVQEVSNLRPTRDLRGAPGQAMTMPLAACSPSIRSDKPSDQTRASLGRDSVGF